MELAEIRATRIGRAEAPNHPMNRKARHELSWLRPCDIAVALNMSTSSEYRLRHLPSFPKPNALGLYSREEVFAFVQSLKSNPVGRSVGRPRIVPSQKAQADTSSADAPGSAENRPAATPSDTPERTP